MSCPCCGLLQRRPPVAEVGKLACARCHTRLHDPLEPPRGNGRTAALALSALSLYPLAITLPILRVEEFGHHSEASILSGTVDLWASGEILVGSVVLLCSLVLPVLKLSALLVLSSGRFLRRRHRARTYHLVEWTGRWGMLDVLLVAVVVAVMKLGDLVEVRPGTGAAAFGACVLLSLLASAAFDPRVLWSGAEEGAR